MSRYGHIPCDIDEDDEPEEIANLRNLFFDFEILFELCMTRPLTSVELVTLNDAHAELKSIEASKWVGVDKGLVETIQSRVDQRFPMICFILDLLP